MMDWLLADTPLLCRNLVFVLKDGSRLEVKAPVGRSLLEVAHHYSVDIEGQKQTHTLVFITFRKWIEENILKQIETMRDAQL